MGGPDPCESTQQGFVRQDGTHTKCHTFTYTQRKYTLTSQMQMSPHNLTEHQLLERHLHPRIVFFNITGTATGSAVKPT